MNKSEIAIVGLLVAVLLAWGYTNRASFTQKPGGGDSAALTQTNAVPAALPADTALQASTEKKPAAPAVAIKPAVDLEPLTPEQTVVLSDTNLSLTISSHSAGIVTAEFNAYRAELDSDSGPLQLDLRDLPALALRGGSFETPGEYTMELRDDGKAVELDRTLDGGIRVHRTIAMTEAYRLKITDVLSNPGAQPVTLLSYGVGVGPMRLPEGAKGRDLTFLGLDSLAAYGGERVQYWIKSSFFNKSPVPEAFLEAAGPNGDLPLSAVYHVEKPVLWAAAKSKFFVQILYAGENTAGCDLIVWRLPGPAKKPVITAAGAAVTFASSILAPGESVTREMSYYLGPKKYTLLKQLGSSQEDVMDFGRWFGWICKILLPILTGIHGVIPSYGIAVILLTVMVRIVFWPITHKSTESMKRMQALQPLVTEIRAKYKDKPQKMNQEMMALYKEHKVNPMSGCLPMVVQIPVFIALFTVLQSAVELRFAPFLWIKDLSQPENLLVGVWPLPFGLNILPLFMTGLTLWQQKLTPSGGDPQQQKMMMMMPVMFLFLFYNMASALVLYWSVSQALSIMQMLMQRRKTAAKEAAKGLTATASAPAPARRRKK